MEEITERNGDMLQDVLDGMRCTPKSLPSKYFYDERGSQLFDEITRLAEYYPTRTERKLMQDNVEEMGEYLGDQVILIEPGSGSSEKTRILLNAIESIKGYIPIDISKGYLKKVAKRLRKDYPELEVLPISVDYTRSFKLPELKVSGRRVVFFPGSTIGNFKPKTVHRFFEVISNIVGASGGVLIGVDLKKDVEVLEAAYNDSEGVTAEFNKNMLKHLNREIGAQFKPELMDHKAIWNEEEGRIEMRLYANESHSISVNGNVFEIEKGEFIHTENSHKYSLSEFEELVAPWFDVTKVWTDRNDYFSVQFLEPK
jgi:dimethylhistidine N-methyltransferase